jgi:formamidopyrimidine-DNA glycosylase
VPELPEVETMCRGIKPIVGSLIRDVRRPISGLRPITITPRLESMRRRVVGRRIAGIARAGKRVVVELDGKDRIVFEPRMTGRVLLAGPPNADHVRLVFELTGGLASELLFWDQRGLGQVHLFSSRQFLEKLGPHRLGPDALEITPQTLRDRLGSSRRAVKVALLDQTALAGVGNLYASEILHRVGLHPETPCNGLRADEWIGLHAAMIEVLQEAIHGQGSTLADGTYRDPQNRAGGFQERHRVYQRAGLGCLQCGEARIVRLVQSQRSTFFCPHCQRLRSPRKKAATKAARAGHSAGRTTSSKHP